ncbi:MAG: hypothetical protein ACW99H_02970 [Candidatus Thorarchaeota archaeon]|jgi:hypothetical protein
MSSSIDSNLIHIQVTFYKKTGEVDNGFLIYSKDGPILRLTDHSKITNLDGVKFKIATTKNLPDALNSLSTYQVTMIPEAVEIHGYSKDVASRIEIYPPSSRDWLSHVVIHGKKAIFSIQDVPERNRKLLTIVDLDSSNLIDAYLVHPYETAILTMKRDWSVYNDLHSRDSLDSDIYAKLQRNSPSWSTISKLVEGVTIPNLTMMETAEETLDQLVPKSYPETTRRQILAFLAWLEDAEIPKDDPLDLSYKYLSTTAFRYLVRGHLRCMLDGVASPQYVKILTLADKGQLKFMRRPPVEIAEQNPWALVEWKLNELFPDWTGRVVKHAMDLTKENQIVTNFPVPRYDGTKSKKAWSERFALDNHGLLMRGHIHKEALGLVPIVYLGSAHRWPHKHLEWSARLGYESEKQPHLQVMIMPSSAVERVSRIMPSTRLVKRSIKQLGNEFGSWKGNQPIRLSYIQARILDLISWGIYISGLETKRYKDYYGIDNQTIEEVLTNLLEKNVFVLQYLFIFENLKSINLVAEGPADHICSLSRAFLRHSPSTQVRIAENGKFSIITSRVPEGDVHTLLSSLTNLAPENDVTLRALPISAYAGYRNNLYQRLWKDVGVWDDDISGLITQARLRSKEDI